MMESHTQSLLLLFLLGFFSAVSTFILQVDAIRATTKQQYSDAEVVITGCRAPLVVFGASMVDVGENAIAMPFRSAAEFKPFGVDYFGRPAARFSNGRLIIDFISQGLGYGLLDPYLNSIEPNFAHGVNFASSGATARNTTVTGNGTDSSRLFSLDIQVDQFKAFKERVIKAQSNRKGSLKTLPTMFSLSKGIYFIEIAHNDYIQSISYLLTSSESDVLSFVSSVISSMENSIRDLHNEGAGNIVVMNLIPLGCIPGFVSMFAYSNLTLDSDKCIQAVNHIINVHNTHLQALIDKLRVQLLAKELVMLDAHAIYIDAIRDPSKYGVKYPFRVCCGAGGGEYNFMPSITCGQKGNLNGKLLEAKRCNNPSEYISWDGLHPVESFAKFIANGFLTYEYLNPSLSINEICKK